MMQGEACISLNERSTSFQLCAWAFPVYRHLKELKKNVTRMETIFK